MMAGRGETQLARGETSVSGLQQHSQTPSKPISFTIFTIASRITPCQYAVWGHL